MRKLSETYLLGLAPVLLGAPVVALLALPLWLSLTIVALLAFVPTAFLLRRERLRSDDRLREYMAFTRAFIDVIPQPMYVKDADSRYVLINKAFAAELQKSVEQIEGLTTQDIQKDKGDSKLSRDEDLSVIAGNHLRIERQDKNPITGEDRYRVIMKGSCQMNGKPVLVGANFDITNWWRSERNLKEAQSFLQQSLESEVALRQRTEAFIQRLIDVIPDPVYIKKSGGRYEMVNEAFARYRNVDKLNFKGFKPSQTPDQRQLSMDEDSRVLAGEEITKEDHTIRQATGEEVFRIISKRPSIFVDGEPVIVGVEHHITEWRIAERELKRLAEEDALTGIANRRHFNREAMRAIEHAHRNNESLSLIMLDIDHFKHINDNHGHNVGDEVLREMAQRLHDCFRKSDLPGRWGGEEFIALLPYTMLDTALKIAERLRAQLANKPIATSSGELCVTVSGGGAQLLPGDNLESLVARADAALYRAKHGGRNRIEFNTDDQLRRSA